MFLTRACSGVVRCIQGWRSVRSVSQKSKSEILVEWCGVSGAHRSIRRHEGIPDQEGQRHVNSSSGDKIPGRD